MSVRKDGDLHLCCLETPSYQIGALDLPSSSLSEVALAGEESWHTFGFPLELF